MEIIFCIIEYFLKLEKDKKTEQPHGISLILMIVDLRTFIIFLLFNIRYF